MNKLGFLGAGNMGSAIINGIIDSGFSQKNETKVFLFEKDTNKAETFAKKNICICSDEKTLVSNCDYIVLAVKPQALADVLDTISPFLENKVIISICAGIDAEFIRKHTSEKAKVILVMPNTPMMLGLGASAISRTDEISDEEFAYAKNIFSCCGIAEEVPVDKMKEIIAINSSSPAFIYLFAKGFIDYAEEQEIDKDATMKLFSQTLVGAAKMLTDSGMTVDELIKQVSSPGGTTIAGLEKLYDGNLLESVKDACESCTKRAYELAE